MHWSGWIVVMLGVFLGGWLVFDGTWAITVGDYVTPQSGAYVGQLGPWSRLVTAVGIEPRSSLMKGIHVALGFLWLATVICFALCIPGAWWGVIACAIASLWYLPFGTLIGVVQVMLLLLMPLLSSGRCV
jgi:hypothetical protein